MKPNQTLLDDIAAELSATCDEVAAPLQKQNPPSGRNREEFNRKEFSCWPSNVIREECAVANAPEAGEESECLEEINKFGRLMMEAA